MQNRLVNWQDVLIQGRLSNGAVPRRNFTVGHKFRMTLGAIGFDLEGAVNLGDLRKKIETMWNSLRAYSSRISVSGSLRPVSVVLLSSEALEEYLRSVTQDPSFSAARFPAIGFEQAGRFHLLFNTDILCQMSSQIQAQLILHELMNALFISFFSSGQINEHQTELTTISEGLATYIANGPIDDDTADIVYKYFAYPERFSVEQRERFRAQMDQLISDPHFFGSLALRTIELAFGCDALESFIHLPWGTRIVEAAWQVAVSPFESLYHDYTLACELLGIRPIPKNLVAPEAVVTKQKSDAPDIPFRELDRFILH